MFPLLQQILYGGGVGGGAPGGPTVNTPPFFPGNPGADMSKIAQQGNFGGGASGGAQPSGFFDKADQFLQKPGGNFLLNLLAQEGYSTTPQSPLGAVGRAGLMTAQQGQQSQFSELQKRLLESQIGVNRARAQPKQEGFTPLTASEKKDLGIPAESFAQRDIRTGQIKIDDPPGALVSVNNEASVPAGFRAIRDAQGRIEKLEPIPGGPKDTSGADEKRREGEVKQADIVTQEIDRALSVMGTGGEKGVLPDTGFGAALAGVPGTDAQKVANNLKTIKANIGFQQLNKMREASPTGGALGQVSEREIGFLQSVAGSLDQSQSREDLQFNLNRLWNAYMDVIHGPGEGPKRRPLEVSAGKPEQDGGANLPDGVTEADVRFTMQRHGLTREQVLERL